MTGQPTHFPPKTPPPPKIPPLLFRKRFFKKSLLFWWNRWIQMRKNFFRPRPSRRTKKHPDRTRLFFHLSNLMNIQLGSYRLRLGCWWNGDRNGVAMGFFCWCLVGWLVGLGDFMGTTFPRKKWWNDEKVLEIEVEVIIRSSRFLLILKLWAWVGQKYI